METKTVCHWGCAQTRRKKIGMPTRLHTPQMVTALAFRVLGYFGFTGVYGLLRRGLLRDMVWSAGIVSGRRYNLSLKGPIC